ncbi:guard cell S-type anion channel SLAC1 [Selaginella moellendorffii]|nr:guard cell S-type anion channel SLAC1 [Selaginella moellendorffii]|eukprot:XP_024518750.1 guard cell S-type anion channel SLAC1 [Selaginella moellendorffii]
MDQVHEPAGSKQSKNYQRFSSQLGSTPNPDLHRWRRSFSGVMRREEPLSPWKRRTPDTYTMFQTRSPMSRLSFNSRNRDTSAAAAAAATAATTAAAVNGDPTSPRPLEANVPAGRYLDALQGPELEVLKESEDLLLPTDQTWPFLLRFPINSFGIVLGLGSQTILWKKLSLMPSMRFLHIPLHINFVLWCVALCAYTLISLTYVCKCIFYFEAVRREFYHPVRINFFFAPWVCGMFLTLGVPPTIAASIHPAAWLVFMSPLVVLELKIYGQWLSGGERRLSKVANPATHVSIVGNFVGSLLGATVEWKELATFFWAVGIAHYVVVFVTLYQRLPTNELLTRDMHPVYFLFLAVPSTASVAWEKITSDFGYVSKLVFFLGLFLLFSLVVRVSIFRGFKFSLTWWAYTFPLTAVAIASIHYAVREPGLFTQGLATVISFVAVTVVFLLFVFTLVHAFVWRTLFPNDIAIAITRKKRRGKPARKNILHSSGSFDKETNQAMEDNSKTRKVPSVTISVGCS